MSTSTTSSVRFPLPLALALVVALSGAGAAFATVTGTFDPGTGLFTAASDDADPLVVDCGFFEPTGLVVTVNGDSVLTGAQILCADVQRFQITGGPGANPIDLGALVPGEFTALTATALAGGPGDDTVVGSFAGDTFTWNNGDNTDTVDLGAGEDRVVVDGAPGDDAFVVLAGAAGRVLFQRLNLVPFDIDFTGAERLEVNGLEGDDDVGFGDLTGVADLLGVRIDGGGGDDTVNASGLPEGILPDGSSSTCTELAFVGVVLCGGAGADDLAGSEGGDLLDGGDGDDVLLANGASDLILGGDGNDLDTWNPGDGSDVFDGGDGDDRQVVNGGGADEIFEITAGPAAGDAVLARTAPAAFAVTTTAVEALELDGGDGAEIVTTEGLPGVAQFLDGGEPSVFPGDLLIVLGFDGDLAQTPVVELPGAGPISHVAFEFKDGAEPAAIPALSPAGLAALALSLSLLGALLLRRPRGSSAVLIAAAALAAAPPAAAVDGVLEIHPACVAAGCFPGDDPGFPVEITQPGGYRLTGNLAVPDENTTAVVAVAGDVTIDLGGFTVRGVTECSFSNGTVACAPVGVGRGVQGFGAGVGVRNGVVRGMGENGLMLGPSARVEDLVIEECGGSGVIAQSGRIQRTIARLNQLEGFASGGIAPLDLESCTALNNGEHGFLIGLGTLTASSSTLNGGDGVRCDLCTVTGCQIHGNFSDGIQVQVHATVRGNTVTQSDAFGLTVAGAGSAGYGENVFELNNSGNETQVNPNGSAFEIGINVCRGDTTCP